MSPGIAEIMFTVLQEVTSGGLVLQAATICCSCAAAVFNTGGLGERNII